MLTSLSFSMPLFLGVLLGYLLGLVSRGLWKNRAMKNLPSIFLQFDNSLLGLMLISAFIVGVFLTYFFFV
jgi:Na+/H+-dicarboxylate symporter